jgi:hypothetical protein
VLKFHMSEGMDLLAGPEARTGRADGTRVCDLDGWIFCRFSAQSARFGAEIRDRAYPKEPNRTSPVKGKPMRLILYDY